MGEQLRLEDALGTFRVTVPKVRTGTIARSSPPHGTRARYLHRSLACRCLACRRANTEYQADYRARLSKAWLPRPVDQLM